MSEITVGDLANLEPKSESGAALLREVDAMLARFVVFPSTETRWATALWVLHTHLVDAFETSPRLAFLSPEPGSGKTRALEIVEMLVPNPLLTMNVTPAYLIRKLSDEARPTLLFDEIDTVFGPKAKSDNEEVRGLLNSGYRRGATSGRCVVRGKTVLTEDFPSFAAVALAGLNDLPDTVLTRSVVVRMQRRAPHQTVQPFRRRVHEPEGHALRARIATWAVEHFDSLQDAWPTLPEEVQDRNADVWEPLIAIADSAGEEWPERARVSAVSLVSLAGDERGSLGLTLLDDLRVIFAATEYMGTKEILDALHQLDESPWSNLKGKPLDANALAFQLGRYGIKSSQIKAINRKGYRRADFEDAWEAYLASVPSGSDLMGKPISKDESQSELPLSHPGGETGETRETGVCVDCGLTLSQSDLAEGLPVHATCRVPS